MYAEVLFNHVTLFYHTHFLIIICISVYHTYDFFLRYSYDFFLWTSFASTHYLDIYLFIHFFFLLFAFCFWPPVSLCLFIYVLLTSLKLYTRWRDVLKCVCKWIKNFQYIWIAYVVCFPYICWILATWDATLKWGRSCPTYTELLQVSRGRGSVSRGEPEKVFPLLLQFNVHGLFEIDICPPDWEQLELSPRQASEQS